MYIHSTIFGLSPQVFPISFLHAKKMFLHFFICVSICSFQFKFSSSVTPRYFAVGLILISVLLHLKLFGFVIALFLVQNMICVLTFGFAPSVNFI